MADERSAEIPWLLQRCAQFPALDVGSNESRYLTDLPGPVDGIDLRAQERPGLRHFYQADIRTWQAPEKYPTVIALSTVEHVGLACEAYGTPDDDVEWGDRRAVGGCMRALHPSGTLLLTVPAHLDGERRTFHGWYRSYTSQGLADLLDGYDYEVETVFNAAWPVGGVHLAVVHNRPPAAQVRS